MQNVNVNVQKIDISLMFSDGYLERPAKSKIFEIVVGNIWPHQHIYMHGLYRLLSDMHSKSVWYVMKKKAMSTQT